MHVRAFLCQLHVTGILSPRVPLVLQDAPAECRSIEQCARRAKMLK